MPRKKISSRERKLKDKRRYARSSLRHKGSSGDRIFNERFEVPFSINCSECYSVIAKGVKIIGSKKPVGYYRSTEILRYLFQCPCCGYKIVMEGISGELKYKVVKGAVKYGDIKKSGGASRIDFESQKMEHNKKYRDSIVPGSSVRFRVPFRLECQGCNSVIAVDVEINGNKISVGNYSARKIWRYIMECPCCGYNIVIERTSGDSKFEIIDGAIIYVPPKIGDCISLVDEAYVDASCPIWTESDDFRP